MRSTIEPVTYRATPCVRTICEPHVEFDVTSKPLSKSEIEEVVMNFIEYRLEEIGSGTLYIYFKQLELAAKFGVEELRDRAFDSFGYQLGGAISGTILGHEVSISYPNEWHYSAAVDELKERHKKELAEVKEREEAEGIARRTSGKGRITVTLRAVQKAEGHDEGK